MKKILFMGDSITDFLRTSFGQGENLGMGYARLIACNLSYEYPDEYEFVNRGISGNRIVDLLQRIKKDAINHKPDYMSILIGVNDVWHEFDFQNGVDTKRFELFYDLYIQQLKEALPDLKIMIMEPFLLNTGAAEKNFDQFMPEVREKAAVAKRIAEKHGLKFIPLQEKLEEACKKAPASWWLYDGVHPAPAGHELIKNEWIKAFEEIK